MKTVSLAELTDNPIKLYAKLHHKGIKPVGKKEVYREVEYFRVKKRLTKQKKFLVNLYAESDVRNFV